MNKNLVIISFSLLIISGFLILSREKQPPRVVENNQGEEKLSRNKEKLAIIDTNKGVIKIELYPDKAPKTVENFINKSREGFYNDLIFHRVEDWVIQGGDPNGDGTGGGEMETELNELPFEEGSVGVARGGDLEISNDSQFFITKKESAHLNNQYTNFGKVIEGLETVNNIEIGDKILSIFFE